MTYVTKRIGLFVAAAASVAAVLMISVPAASAAGGFQLYQNSNYGGGQKTFSGSLTEFYGQKWNNGQSMQNSASSMQNYSNRYVGMWNIGTSCTGASYTAKPNSIDASFSNNNFDNMASCLKFL